MEQFTFYKNYYYLIDLLDEKRQQIIALTIIKYMFENIEPNFKDKKLLNVWSNIKMPLDTSKKQSVNRKKQKETKKKPNENQKETKTKPKRNQKETNNIFLFLISNFLFLKDRGLLRGKILEWVEYKNERKETYTEIGFRKLLSQIENNVKEYGEANVIDLIDECMASNYKGIIFEKLKGKPKSKVPAWANEEIETIKATPEEEAEFRENLKKITED